MRRAGLVLAVPLLVLGLSACSFSIGGADKIDQHKAETFLRDNLHPRVKSVSCPKDVKIVKGGTFTCTVVFVNGKTATVTLHMTDSSGGVHVTNKDIRVTG